MPLSDAVTLGLLQAATISDTLVARMIPTRDLFDWASVILQIVVLLLGAGMLITVLILLLSLRKALHSVQETIEKLTKKADPAIETATRIVTDAGEIVAMVRTDVDRVRDAAEGISKKMVDVVEVTSKRIDEANAVLDVIQTQLEETAIGTVSAMHGLRVGTQALAHGLVSGSSSGKPRLRRFRDDLEDEYDDEMDDVEDELDDVVDEMEDALDDDDVLDDDESEFGNDRGKVRGAPSA